MIIVDGKEFVTLNDEIFVGGKKVLEVYAGNRLVYPIGGSAWRIILDWNVDPRDLDSHLVYNGRHVYYAHKIDQDAWLDIDDTTSYGPENTYFVENENTLYHFYVYHYAGSGSIGTTSNAIVRIYNIYNLQGSIMDYRPGKAKEVLFETIKPPQQNGAYWHVCTIQNNKIKVLNYINNTAAL